MSGINSNSKLVFNHIRYLLLVLINKIRVKISKEGTFWKITSKLIFLLMLHPFYI